jgi:hypothetical protein
VVRVTPARSAWALTVTPRSLSAGNFGPGPKVNARNEAASSINLFSQSPRLGAYINKLFHDFKRVRFDAALTGKTLVRQPSTSDGRLSELSTMSNSFWVRFAKMTL